MQSRRRITVGGKITLLFGLLVVAGQQIGN